MCCYLAIEHGFSDVSYAIIFGGLSFDVLLTEQLQLYVSRRIACPC